MKTQTAQKQYIIGIDTGGTFTDITVLDMETGENMRAKAPTTPHDFSVGVMDAIGEAAKLLGLSRRRLLEQTNMVKHGTTVGTNAVITHRGAKTGFLTTKGFEDTTLIGRAVQRVDGLNDEEVRKMLLIKKPTPLVPKSYIKGVYERIDFKGNIVVPLNIQDAGEQIRALVEDEKVEAIGVSLLHSYTNPVHECKLKEMIIEMYPEHNIFLTLSHELVPLKREYARANTVILNCFIGKVMESYLRDLNTKLQEEDFHGRLLVMQANGGLLGWERVPPVRTLSSGPSGGVIASKYMADLLGHANVVSTDMGGTSFDVSLIRDGRWDYERESIISRWRVSLPMIKVESIGAGGGTTARVDTGLHRLLVGPDSAGGVPGPVCYNAGGTEPTVCDADLVLGFLNPDYFLGGKIKINKAKAMEAILEKIAIPMRIDVVEAAAGIFSIVNAHMANLTRVIAMRTGLPPEEFVLYAFGGTGPIHAAFFAAELGIKKICIFPSSAVFSSFGIVGADVIRTTSFSLGYRMPVAPDVLNSRIKEVENNLAQEMEREMFGRQGIEFRHVFNMRWARQVLYHSVPLPAKEYKTDKDVTWLIETWAEDFEKIYGKGAAYTRAGIELVSMDIDVIGQTFKPSLKHYPPGKTDLSTAFKGYREVFSFQGTKDFVQASTFEWDRLKPGCVIDGPAIVENPTTTVAIPSKKRARVDSFLNITLEL